MDCAVVDELRKALWDPSGWAPIHVRSASGGVPFRSLCGDGCHSIILPCLPDCHHVIRYDNQEIRTASMIIPLENQ